MNKMDQQIQQSLIKTIPKTVAVKAVASTSRNILVQGPNNKILSLKIKSPISLNECTQQTASGAISSSTQKKPTVHKLATVQKVTTTTKTNLPSNVKATSTNKLLTNKDMITNGITILRKPKSTIPSLTKNCNQIDLKPMSILNSSALGSKIKTIMSHTPAPTQPIKLKNISSNITISKVSKINKNAESSPPLLTIEKKSTTKLVDILQTPPTYNNYLPGEYKTITRLINLQQCDSPGISVNQNNVILNQDIISNQNKGYEDTTTIITQYSVDDLKNPILTKPTLTTTAATTTTTTTTSSTNDKMVHVPPKLLKHLTDATNQSLKTLKIRNIETMINKSTKVKQQSLLKVKAIDTIQKPYRLAKGRSKSLNLHNRLPIIQQLLRRSSGLENKPYVFALKNMDKKPKLNIEINPKKMNTIASNEPNFNCLKSEIDVKPYIKLPPPLIPFTALVKPQIISYVSRKQPKIKKVNPPQNSDLYTTLKWKNGIGTTADNAMSFHLNEYNLLEIYEKGVFRPQSGICYEKPIFEREIKSKNTSDYTDPLYFCRGCNCHGAAVDFLAPSYCSYECIGRYQRKRATETDLYTSIRMKDEKTQLRNASRKRKMLRKANNWPAPNEVAVKTEIHKIPRIFSWTTYLSSSKAEPATIDLFLNPFPCGPNLFEVGMKLEAIDPEHSSMFCVCSIVEKKGYRLKLHFDGFSRLHDFWVNADSMDIFPPGWCQRTNRKLHPPKNINNYTFTWSSYLIKTKSIVAPRNLFTHLNSSSSINPFKIGMKFEADDLRNTRKVCVASVADVLDNRILVHFDGWDESYDYWVDCCSPYIHPVNWYKLNDFEIVPPPEWMGPFCWYDYFQLTNGIPATVDLFETRDPIDFQAGMKLEIVDKKNPALIRPATVIGRDQYELKIIFDGWPRDYIFWVVDDNPDIHPIGWCEATGHELESPPGFESLPIIMPCPMPACRGIGNALDLNLDYHASIDDCPYEISKWAMEIDKPSRLGSFDIRFSVGSVKYGNYPSPEITPDISIPELAPLSADLNTPITNYPAGSVSDNCMSAMDIDEDEKPYHILSDTNYDSNDRYYSHERIIEPEFKLPKELLCDYGPRLRQIESLWLQNVRKTRPKEQMEIRRNPLKWKIDDVADFIRKLSHCESIADIFRREEIDGAAFLSMRQQDLTDILNLRLGPAIKIYSQVLFLRSEVVSRFQKNKR